MQTSTITSDTLSSSVIAVPPLARNSDETLNTPENEKQIRHLESGGVTTLLYGGNAILYHVALSEYASLLELLATAAAENTLVIPSVGPAYGTMMEQAAVLREFAFPTAMILPQRDVTTSSGVASAVRRFVEKIERPALLYIKHEGYIDVADVRNLIEDNLLSGIKYAIVRDDPSEDNYLRSLTDNVDTGRVVSGIGEQPALIHLRDFKLSGFTSGCVCIAPYRSMELLHALKSGDYPTAAKIQNSFRPLEDLRNSINPVRVLHRAVELAGIAQMGPLLPLLSDVDPGQASGIQDAACQLREWERQGAKSSAS